MALVVLVGVTTADGRLLTLDEEALIVAHRPLWVLAGAVLFGAGLLQLFAWRLRRTPAGARAGVVLIVLGLPTAFFAGMEPLLHDQPVPAMLNPWTAALVSLTATAAAAACRAEWRAGSAPGLVAVVGSAVTALGFCALLFVGSEALDLSKPAHVLIELGVAALWFGWSALAAGRGRPGDRPGSFGADVLSGLGCVWLVRGAAVLGPGAWGLVSAALLTLVAAVVLVRASRELGDAAHAQREQVRAADAALAAATEALAVHARRREDLTHAARNAMLALRLATRAQAQHAESLDADTRSRLEQAVQQQLAELEALVAGRTDEGDD